MSQLPFSISPSCCLSAVMSQGGLWMGAWLMNSFPQDIHWRVSMGMPEPCACLLFSILVLLHGTLWKWCEGDSPSTDSSTAMVPLWLLFPLGVKAGARTLVWLLRGSVALYKTSSMSEVCMRQKSGCQGGDLRRDGTWVCSFVVVLLPGVFWLPWCTKMDMFTLKHNEQIVLWFFFLLIYPLFLPSLPPCRAQHWSWKGLTFPFFLCCSENCFVACTPLTLHSTNIPLWSLPAATVLSLPDKTGSFLLPGEILNEESHEF